MTIPANPDNTLQSLLALLASSKFSWFSSVRPDGRPHSVPIWHVLHAGCLYFSTSPKSVKVANIRTNPHVVVGAFLDNPESGLIVEGLARLRPELRETVSKFFVEKYEWDITEADNEYNALIEVEPARLIAWGDIGEGRWSGEEVRKAARGEPVT